MFGAKARANVPIAPFPTDRKSDCIRSGLTDFCLYLPLFRIASSAQQIPALPQYVCFPSINSSFSEVLALFVFCLFFRFFFSFQIFCFCFYYYQVCHPTMSSVVLKNEEQKVKNSPEQKRGSIIRQTKTDVTHMKTAITNIPPSHPPQNDHFPPQAPPNKHLLRGTLVNRTYGLHKNLYISLFLLTIFGPVITGDHS